MENKTFDYVKYNTMEGSNKKRICGYFVVSDRHKSNDVAIRLTIIIFSHNFVLLFIDIQLYILL